MARHFPRVLLSRTRCGAVHTRLPETLDDPVVWQVSDAALPGTRRTAPLIGDIFQFHRSRTPHTLPSPLD
jgi:hypothetical protein